MLCVYFLLLLGQIMNPLRLWERPRYALCYSLVSYYIKWFHSCFCGLKYDQYIPMNERTRFCLLAFQIILHAMYDFRGRSFLEEDQMTLDGI